jgi:hypothetical protein
LLDEGTVLFRWEYLAEHTEGITAQKQAHAIVRFWQMQRIAVGVRDDAVCKTLHSSTARRCLRNQGFHWKDLTKGLYNKNGHERQDVMDYRENKFLPLMAELKPKMVEFYLSEQDIVKAHNPDPIGPEERHIVPMYQDESTYNANNRLSEGWVTED